MYKYYCRYEGLPHFNLLLGTTARTTLYRNLTPTIVVDLLHILILMNMLCFLASLIEVISSPFPQASRVSALLHFKT